MNTAALVGIFIAILNSRAAFAVDELPYRWQVLRQDSAGQTYYLDRANALYLYRQGEGRRDPWAHFSLLAALDRPHTSNGRQVVSQVVRFQVNCTSLDFQVPVVSLYSKLRPLTEGDNLVEQTDLALATHPLQGVLDAQERDILREIFLRVCQSLSR